MKRFVFITLSVFLLSFNAVLPSLAQQDREVIIHLFEREDCKHCKDESFFLNTLFKEDKNLILRTHYVDRGDKELFESLTISSGLARVTPITFIEGYFVQGFDKPTTTGEQIKNLIREARKKTEPLTIEAYIENPQPKSIFDTEIFCLEEEGICSTERPEFSISIPFIGSINLFDYSLPTLALILGFVDGFNPCAMWVLVIFLTVLIEVGSRKRMWQLVGIFILAEAIMYYLILNVWFTAWDFVGLDTIITPLVGAIAVGAGIFFLNEWRKGDATCKVGSSESKKRTINRIKQLATAEMTVATIIGAVFLAFSVNIIEFACSIGIPQAFTKVIELNPISMAYKQFLMFLYIFMYMIDDIIIFSIALYSFEKIGITTKYTNLSHCIGGFLMLILGLLLIFYPEALVFF